jgi:hypothetical protein
MIRRPAIKKRSWRDPVKLELSRPAAQTVVNNQ